MTAPGAEPVQRRPRIASFWREHRARWSLPLVIILIIGIVALIDHLGSPADQSGRGAPTPGAGDGE